MSVLKSIQKQAIVFGGTGFIGQSLLRRLAKDSVCGIFSGSSISTQLQVKGFKYQTFADLNTDSLDQTLPTTAYYLTHHGAAGGIPVDQENIAPLIAANQELLEAAILASSKLIITNFIYVSSGGVVYGEVPRIPIDEEQPTRPISPYGHVKVDGERLVASLGAALKLPFTIIRPSNVYGPGQSKTLISITFDRLRNRQKVPIFGQEGATRDYVFVEDLVEALVLTGNDSGNNKIYNVGTGVGTNTLNLVTQIANCLNIESPEFEFLPSRGTDVSYNILNSTKFSNDYGWQPKVTLQEGLKRLLDGDKYK